MRVAASALLFVLIGCSRSSTPPSPLLLDGGKSAISGSTLVESIGIETLGGVFSPLLEAGCELPCEETFSFSTAEDQQRSIDIRLYRGVSPLAAENYFLGTFAITKIAPAPRGVPKTDITIEASADGVYFWATEQSNGELQVTRMD